MKSCQDRSKPLTNFIKEYKRLIADSAANSKSSWKSKSVGCVSLENVQINWFETFGQIGCG